MQLLYLNSIIIEEFNNFKIKRKSSYIHIMANKFHILHVYSEHNMDKQTNYFIPNNAKCKFIKQS